MGKGPMNEDKNGTIGGFSDEPMEFPPFDMGSMPSRGPMPGFMDGMDMPPMGDGTDGMPGPLDMVKMQIAAITDIDGVKGVLTAIIDMMIAKMDDKPETPGKGKGLPQKGKGKKPAGKKPAGKKPAGKKPAGKKPTTGSKGKGGSK